MRKYTIIDACVADQSESKWIDPKLLGKPLGSADWLTAYAKELVSYQECYEGQKGEFEKQVSQNLREFLSGEPMRINGLEFRIEEE